MPTAIFNRNGDFFVPTEYAGGPWTSELQHGSPPAALLCYEVEKYRDSANMHLARLTIDLFRAIPMKPLKLRSQVLREGKRIKVIEAFLSDENGVDVGRALGLFFAKTELEAVPERFTNPPLNIPFPGEFEPKPFIKQRDNQVISGLNGIIDIQRVDEGRMGSGSGICWTRLPIDVISGVETTPNLRAAIASDYGNGIGQVHIDRYTGFINADINLYLHREPAGEWICVKAKGIAEETGIGMVESTLFDLHGAFGKVMQTTMVNQRRPKP